MNKRKYSCFPTPGHTMKVKYPPIKKALTILSEIKNQDNSSYSGCIGYHYRNRNIEDMYRKTILQRSSKVPLKHSTRTGKFMVEHIPSKTNFDNRRSSMYNAYFNNKSSDDIRAKLDLLGKLHTARNLIKS